MKIVILSYSLTGNNDALASSIASQLKAEHLRIIEAKPRKMITIFFDMLLNRIPEVSPLIDNFEEFHLVIFIGPVWMGHIASPFRSYLKYFGNRIQQYAYISISGGADGPHSKLADELEKRIGKKPVAVIDLHIADLLSPVPKPTRKDTSSYHINGDEVKRLTKAAIEDLRQVHIPGV